MAYKIETKEEALWLLRRYVADLKSCDTRVCSIGDCTRCYVINEITEIEDFASNLGNTDIKEPEHEQI